mmetsp:Transcript_21628/g.32195  ORF Transcript_21628/g.32195 Transcript_21628/m.32195 type:complete len:464 (-) Transcript_21628:360-1751(-)
MGTGDGKEFKLQEAKVSTTAVGIVVALTAIAFAPALTVQLGTSSQIGISPLAINVLLSGIGCVASLYAIPNFREMFVKAKLYGIDLNKASTVRDSKGKLIRPYQGYKVPEAMGVISGMIFLVIMFFFIPVAFSDEPAGFPYNKLAQYLAALLSIACMCFLGFADNVLDLRWRHKLWLPMAATLPILMVYYVNGGVTYVMVPNILRDFLPESMDLGPLYYIFMAALGIFCTNAINILAGVNGLEAGQAVVIGLSVLANNLLQLQRLSQQNRRENHLFSAMVMIPFIATTSALLYHNWFPSRVFVGDAFCYFAGMTFAVVAILGHFSKTLLLFFIPQIANFLYSCPQLFKLVPCPRHRMPSLDAKTGLIGMSYCEFEPSSLSFMGSLVVKILSTLRMVKTVPFQKEGKTWIKMNNLTLINWTLFVMGPMREDWLTITLLLEQALGTILAFLIRYKLAGLFYSVVE